MGTWVDEAGNLWDRPPPKEKFLKLIATVKSQELMMLALGAVLKRPEFKGKHASLVELVYDAEEKSVMAQAVLFDTAKAALEYFELATKPEPHE